jgi:Asp-tRNA(Asn)/Glu-tRNA(Gln) amidotransferase A subunit family amidase
VPPADFLLPLVLGSLPNQGCSLFGLKPTFGRIGVHGRCQEGSSQPATLHFGPLASNLHDLTYIYKALAFFCPQMPLPSRPDWSPQIPLACLQVASPTLQGVRIGVFTPWLRDSTPLDAKLSLETLEHLVKSHGAIAKDVIIDGLEDIRVAHGVSIMTSMLDACKDDGVLDKEDTKKKLQLGLDARAKLAVAVDFSSDDKVAAEIVRTRAMSMLTDVFKEVDILLTPSLGEHPARVPQNLETGQLDVATDSAAMRFCLLANLTGIPALALPVGEASTETNIRPSIQLMGAPWTEDTLLRAAACCTV